MSANIARRLIPVVKAYPKTVGLIFAGLGAYAVFEGVQNGRELEPFMGGFPVSGRLVDIQSGPSGFPAYIAEVRIEASGAASRIEHFPITRKQRRGMKAGDSIQAIQARDGSANYILARRMRAAAPVSIRGVPVTFEAFLGVVFLAFAAWLIVMGPRYFGGDA